MRKRPVARVLKRSLKIGFKAGTRTSRFAGRTVQQSTQAVMNRVSGVQKYLVTATETNRQVESVLQQLEMAIRERDLRIAALEKELADRESKK